jgi:hypothetical protein
MKKQERVSATVRTNIEEISTVGNELSDEHLRLVAGGGKKRVSGYTRTFDCCGRVVRDNVKYDY